MSRPNIKISFGRRVRELRAQRGWSQEQLAAQVGLDRSYVGSVERGQRNVSLENIAKFATTFEINLAVLMDFDDG